MKKIYYYFNLKQTSPLRISSGESVETDSDLRMNRKNLPFIPGSSLAGVLRSYFDENEAKILFGDIDAEKSIKLKENVAIESRLIVSDAVLADSVTNDDIVILSRDGIGLDDWGLTINGAKYDFQAVEGLENLIYHAVIEWSGDEKEEKEQIEKIFEPKLREIIHSGLRIGARTSRGYGAMEISVVKKVFLFPENIDAWLEYQPMKIRFELQPEGTKLEGVMADKEQTVIELSLKMKDSFNVRVRTTETEPLEDGSIPDSVPLKNAKGRPVIPGTAWAGAFRHHMRQLLRECKGVLLTEDIFENLDYTVFGKGGRDKNHISSNISFSEMVIYGGCANSIMRNAVDRFTAAPRNTGLFTNQVWTGGKGELKIIIKNNKFDILYLQLLIASIYDLHNGLLSIGGEANIGRGIAEVQQININGRDYTEELRRQELKISDMMSDGKGE